MIAEFHPGGKPVLQNRNSLLHVTAIENVRADHEAGCRYMMFCQDLKDLSIHLLNDGEVITLGVYDSRKIVESDRNRTFLRPRLRCSDAHTSQDKEARHNFLQGDPSLDVSRLGR